MKLDFLLAYTSTSSTNKYSETAIKALFSTLVKDHQESIDKATKAVEASITSCQQAAENVEKLISDARLLLDYLQVTAAKNANMLNVSTEKLTTSLQAEKDNFEKNRTGIQADNTELQSSINSRLDKL